MTFNALLKLVSDDVTGIKSFGKGWKSYLNLPQETSNGNEYSERYPINWVFNVITVSTRGSYNTTNRRTVNGFIGKPLSFSASTDEINTALDEMLLLAIEFMHKTQKSEGVIELLQWRMTEVLNDIDNNHVGWDYSFEVEVVDENTYC